jgi:N6-L-threonylcarbamoyladenine synthase
LGDKNKYKFSSAHVPNFDYSFSGIKTSFLYFIQNNTQKDKNFVTENLNDICASYQDHLIKVLLKNVKSVLKNTGIKHLAIAGGVSANSQLREEIKKLEEELDIKTYIPKFVYCTDNAAMIGVTAYYKLLKKEFAGLSVTPITRMEL